jgi:hypothetical protein
LWALYQRAPKEDSIKELERRKVAVKRKGKMVIIAKTFTKLVHRCGGSVLRAQQKRLMVERLEKEIRTPDP